MRVNIDISQIQKVVQMLVEEEGQESVVITPQQYIDLLKFTDYNGKLVQNMKQFRGKRIVIDGDLSLRGTDANNITNITVNGGLDLTYTKINSIEGIETKSISTYGTPYEQIQIKKQRQIELEKQNVLRQDDEWNLETANKNYIAILANVLFEYLTSSYGDYEAKEPNHDARLQELYTAKERMEEIEIETEDNENLMDLEAIEEEIEELEKRIDIYNLVYYHKYYSMRTFYVLTEDLDESKEKWAVGDNYNTHMSAYERIDELIDDIGIKGFNQSFVEDYIDIEELKETFRDDEENNVRENLEDFFDEEDFEYSDPAVQTRIDEIELFLEDSEIDQEKEDELNEELDELRDSDKTVPENLIEEKVEDLINDLVDDPATVIENYGLNIENYIDIRGFKEGLIQTDGIGHTLNSYDGDYDTIEFNDEEYYILQTEG